MGLGVTDPAGDARATPLERLVAGVNRFGPGAPKAHRLSRGFSRATGTLTPELAADTVGILLRRAQDAMTRYGSAAGTNWTQLTRALANPTAYVAPQVGSVADLVHLYADSVGLPASGPSALGSPGFALVAVGLAVLGFYLLKVT